MARHYHSTPTRKLPEQPDLEQLRKQAKDLLKAFQAGDPRLQERVRFSYPGAIPDPFRLSDAQFVLARAYGFASWPNLRAFIDGVTVGRFITAVQAGDAAAVRAMLQRRPELVCMDAAHDNEHRALHHAVLVRDAAMVRLLMQAGADARKGIYPHRDATTAYAIARDRGYADIVAAIEQEEGKRTRGGVLSPAQDDVRAAIRRGDNGAAIRMLESDSSLIGASDRNNATPLHAAAQACNEEMTAWLLARGADPRLRDLDGLTALDHCALAAGPRDRSAEQFPALAKLLLESGAEMTVRGAVALGDAVRVREMVAGNPGLLRDITWKRGGLVSLAVNHGSADMVRLLLDLGADPDERTTLEELEEPTESWGSPLWCAALAGRLEIAELLLDRGADPNGNVYASGWPLRNAYERDDDAMKRLLIARGAKMQPYMAAELHDTAEAARMLAADAGEQLARELAWSSAGSGCDAILAMALPRLEWPRDDPRWHWVLIQPMRGIEDGPAHEGFFHCLALLLDRGVDANVSKRFGQTPMHFTAARDGMSAADRSRFASMLLGHGARLDLRDHLLESTPLGWACRWGREDLVDLLIARGAPVNERDAEPWATPLAWAKKMGHAQIEARLQESGAQR